MSATVKLGGAVLSAAQESLAGLINRARDNRYSDEGIGISFRARLRIDHLESLLETAPPGLDPATVEACAKTVERHGTRHGSSYQEYFSCKAFAATVRALSGEKAP